MLIQDLQFIEQTAENNSVHGGAGAFTGVNVSAFGSRANADAFGSGFGTGTGANTNTATRTSSGKYFDLSTAVGTSTAYGVTRDGKNSSVSTSVSTGVDTDIRGGFF